MVFRSFVAGHSRYVMREALCCCLLIRLKAFVYWTSALKECQTAREQLFGPSACAMLQRQRKKTVLNMPENMLQDLVNIPPFSLVSIIQLAFRSAAAGPNSFDESYRPHRDSHFLIDEVPSVTHSWQLKGALHGIAIQSTAFNTYQLI